MRDMSVRGVYRRYVVEPAIEFFGTTDPLIVGDPKVFSVRKALLGTALLGPASVGLRSVLEPLAQTNYGPGRWHQNVCDNVVGRVYFTRTWTHVDVRIQLVPDADVTPTALSPLRVAWRTDIEDVWNSPRRTPGGPSLPWRCARAGEAPCRVSFHVHWVTSAAHHVVAVHNGSGHSNEKNWFVMDGPGVAAHEFGHMLGLPDEYVDDDLCPGRSPVNTGTVMDNNESVVPQRLVQWVADAIGSTLQ